MDQESTRQVVALAVKKWRNKRGNLIMVLHEIQNQQGCVPRHVALQIAQELRVPLARIYEVLTFYNYFKLEPPGKFVTSVCMGTACYLKGAPEVMAAFQENLKVQEGSTTADRMFHLQSVRCLGCCGLAPVVMINGKTFSKVRPDDVADMVDFCRDQKVEH